MSNYFGIDIGGTNVKWALMNENFKKLESGSIATDFEDANACVAALIKLVEPYANQIAGIGISAPGGIYEDDPDGTIHRGGALHYMDGCPLGKLLRERFCVPVAVNNDGKCCALGEYAAGALRGKKYGVVVAIGTGIGGGIVINGQVLRGAHCFAGEFSFLTGGIDANSDTLGNSFALSCSWLGLKNLVVQEKNMGEAEAAQLDGRKIFDLVEAGDEAAKRALGTYAHNLDAWLVNIQAVVDPEVIAIAGGISGRQELYDALDAHLDEVLAPFAVYGGAQRPNIVRAELGNDANLYGAVQEAKSLTQNA